MIGELDPGGLKLRLNGGYQVLTQYLSVPLNPFEREVWTPEIGRRLRPDFIV